VKRQALVLSAFLTGLLGGAIAVNQAFIEPNSMFGLNWVVTALVMVVVGGMGTVAGPIIGAFVIYYLVDRALESQPVLQALLSGVLVIAVIVVAPAGIVGVLRAGWPAVARRVAYRRESQGRKKADAPAATSTEQVPETVTPLVGQTPNTRYAGRPREGRNT
jgi:branched-chain amino acid transport system permease protein